MTTPVSAPPELALVAPPAEPAPVAPAPAPPAPRAPLAVRLRPWLPVLAVVLLALAASATSLGNDFAYDDRWIISQNARLHRIGRWWRLFTESYWPIVSHGLYRPFTSLAFLLQWTAGGGHAFVFHLLNVVLYAGVCAAVWWLAAMILPPAGALVAAALFAVHPVHVEAVGNIVGQAELTAALVLIGGTGLYLRWRAAPEGITPRRLLGFGALFGAGLLVKEHVIVLPALLVAAELTVVRDDRPWRARLAALRPALLACTLLALVWVQARIAVLHEFGGDTPHPALLGLPAGARIVGMLGLLPEVGRLLFWPARLYADYSPRHVAFVTELGVFHAAGMLWLAAALLLFAWSWRRSRPAAFGILWFAIAWSPTSNVLLPTGILLAERTLFAPSIGVALALGAAAGWAAERLRAEPARVRRLAAGALAVVLAAGVARSADRQLVWKNNDVLFTTMVRDQPLDAKAHYAYGGWLFLRNLARQAELEWRLAIALNPGMIQVQNDLADRYRENGLCPPAVPLYREVLARNADHARARAGLAVCVAKLGDPDAAIHILRAGFAFDYAAAPLRQTMAKIERERHAPVTPAAPPPEPRRVQGTMQNTTRDGAVEAPARRGK